jgi:hypothetical protein
LWKIRRPEPDSSLLFTWCITWKKTSN